MPHEKAIIDDQDLAKFEREHPITRAERKSLESLEQDQAIFETVARVMRIRETKEFGTLSNKLLLVRTGESSHNKVMSEKLYTEQQLKEKMKYAFDKGVAFMQELYFAEQLGVPIDEYRSIMGNLDDVKEKEIKKEFESRMKRLGSERKTSKEREAIRKKFLEMLKP